MDKSKYRVSARISVYLTGKTIHHTKFYIMCVELSCLHVKVARIVAHQRWPVPILLKTSTWSFSEIRGNLGLPIFSPVTIETPQTASIDTKRNDGALGARIGSVVEKSIPLGPIVFPSLASVPHRFASNPIGIVRLHILGCDVEVCPSRHMNGIGRWGLYVFGAAFSVFGLCRELSCTMMILLIRGMG